MPLKMGWVSQTEKGGQTELRDDTIAGLIVGFNVIWFVDKTQDAPFKC